MEQTTPKLPTLGVAILILTLLLGVGLAVGGEAGQIAAASLNTFPFAGLALLAYLGGSHFNWAWVATGLWLLILMLATLGITLGLGIAVIANVDLTSARTGLPALTPAAWFQIGMLLLLTFGASLFSLLPLIPAVRHALTRLLPINPHSFVHTVALVAVLGLTLLTTVPLLVLGAPPLLTLLSRDVVTTATSRDAAGMLRDQLYSLVWTIPAALVAVGYATRRSFTAALLRLGLVLPTWRQVLLGVVLALGLAALVQVFGLGIEWLWNRMGWPLTDQAAFDELLSFAISPIGALVIGVSAGLGEELGVRGVLQPRLGILLSNLFFTSLHALQYNWDALLVVFLVGMVCGFVRQRTNTTTSAIVHGVYNFTLIMLSLWLGEV